jgi:hypothetical protein
MSIKKPEIQREVKPEILPAYRCSTQKSSQIDGDENASFREPSLPCLIPMQKT